MMMKIMIGMIIVNEINMTNYKAKNETISRTQPVTVIVNKCIEDT